MLGWLHARPRESFEGPWNERSSTEAHSAHRIHRVCLEQVFGFSEGILANRGLAVER